MGIGQKATSAACSTPPVSLFFRTTARDRSGSWTTSERAGHTAGGPARAPASLSARCGRTSWRRETRVRKRRTSRVKGRGWGAFDPTRLSPTLRGKNPAAPPHCGVFHREWRSPVARPPNTRPPLRWLPSTWRWPLPVGRQRRHRANLEVVWSRFRSVECAKGLSDSEDDERQRK